MRTFTRLLTVILAAFGPVVPAGAETLPSQIGYSIYVDGAPAGHSRMKITAAKDVVRFESDTRVELGPNVVELSSLTEADPVTFRIRRFSFAGTKGGMATACNIVLKGDSATGWLQPPGGETRRSHADAHPGGFVIFEDWLMELEVVLALTQSAAPRNPNNYRLLFAGSFLPTDLVAGYTGEVSVESEARSVVARKLEVLISGGQPFESHVDPASGIPLYLHFPGTRTEAFRDDFFGDNPASRYRARAGGSAGH